MKLTDTVVVAHPDTNDPTVLLAGSAVPDWAAGLIGDHVTEKSSKGKTAGK